MVTPYMGALGSPMAVEEMGFGGVGVGSDVAMG